MDKALRGRGLLGVGKAKRPGMMSRQPPKSGPLQGKEREDAFEAVGGSPEGKPHSTREGRIAAGKRTVARFFGKYKKKGAPV